MSDCLEVLFASDNSGRLQTANCFNPHIGTTLMSYKGGGGVSKKSLTVIGNDYLLSADANKPILHVWPLNSQEPMSNLKMVVAGKTSALSASPDGVYCIAGIENKIYIWQTSSGCLMNVVSRHYQNITNIKFNDNGTHFVTSGEDGIVLVWDLANVMAKQTGNVFQDITSSVQPVFNFAHHSLPVTDLYLSNGNSKARLFTVSVDQTCKIYSLKDGTLLLSLVFNAALTSIVVNTLETQLFVGTDTGTIETFSLDPYPRNVDHHVVESENNRSFSGHTKTVTCLSTSMDGRTLASGADDERVIIWDITSRQLLRTFEMKGPITSVFFHLPSKNIFSNQFRPHLILSNFERVSNPEKGDPDFYLLVNERLTSYADDFESTVNPEKQPIENNEDEIANVKEEIKKLKEMNKQLYQFAMDNILNNPIAVGKEAESRKRRSQITNGESAE